MQLLPMVTLVMSEVPNPSEMDIYLTSTQIQASQLDVYLGELDIEQICPTISMKEESGWGRYDPWQGEKGSLKSREDDREIDLSVLDSSSTCSSEENVSTRRGIRFICFVNGKLFLYHSLFKSPDWYHTIKLKYLKFSLNTLLTISSAFGGFYFGGVFQK